MANSQQILEIKLDARNRLLKSERRGVTIQTRKDGFTLRAYLPSKSNPESDQTIQQRVPINLKADIKNLDDVEDQRINITKNKNRAKAVKMLIKAYNDKLLAHEVRMAALEALAESKDKLVLEAIQKSVRNAELLDLEIMIKSVELLSKYGDKESINALVSGLKKSESKVMNLREVIVNAIGKNGSDDHIITLLELYEISRINHQKNSELLSLTLGDMGDERAIPILIEIAKNKDNNLRTRKVAVDVLAKKESPELIDYFIELLGDEDTRQSMNDFTLEVMGDLNNERTVSYTHLRAHET